LVLAGRRRDFASPTDHHDRWTRGGRSASCGRPV